MKDLELLKEQSELKSKFIDLLEFTNSKEYFNLSTKYKQVLQNQRMGMEIYLNAINTRIFEDVDNACVPNLGLLNMFGSIFNTNFDIPKWNNDDNKAVYKVAQS